MSSQQNKHTTIGKWILWDIVGHMDIKYVMDIIALHVQINEKVIK